MATNKNKHKRTTKTAPKHKSYLLRNIILTIVGTALVATGVVFLLRMTAPKKDEPESQPEPEAPTVVEEPEKEPEEEESEEEPEQPDSDPDKTPAQYEGDNPNNLDELTGSISFNSVSGESYKIRVNVDQYLEEGGKCVLTMVPENKNHAKYEKTYSTINNASNTSCDIPDIPIGQLYSGAYDVQVRIEYKNKSVTLRDKVTI